MGQSDHVVQFYEADDYLLKSVRSFIAVGPVTGEARIAMATADHRADLANGLSTGGLDMATFTARGQCIRPDSRPSWGRAGAGPSGTIMMESREGASSTAPLRLPIMPPPETGYSRSPPTS